MNKNEKTLTALLAVTIIILLLLYMNARRVANMSSNSNLQTPDIQPANFTVWQFNVPPLNLTFDNWTPSIGEIYYASGSCMCQG